MLAIRIILALAALLSGLAQIGGQPQMVAEFELIGLGQWFRYFTAAVLILGAVLLLMPRTTVYGAALLCAVCLGALVAHLFILHGDIVHTIIPAAILGFIAWQHRDQQNFSRRSVA